MLNNRLKKEFNNLLTMLDKTSFRKEDKAAVEDLINYNEPGVAIETVIDQLHEYNVRITIEIYNQVESIATKMKMKDDIYKDLKELIQ
jgi:hypothetical protein